MFFRIRRTYQQFRNALRYARIGWGSHDWDWQYAFEEFANKLERLANSIDKNTDTPKEEIERIREAVSLLRKVIADEYHAHCRKSIDEQYGKPEVDHIPIAPGILRLKFSREGEREWNAEEIRDKERSAYELAEELKQADLEKAFKIISDNYHRWWD